MNTVPQGGAIKVVFPNTYQGLDSSCRVTSGPLAIDTNTPVVCETIQPDTIVIKSFAEMTPKYVTVSVFAYNPPTSGETP